MTQSRTKFRPLLLAESCNPEWVSIPLEGWSHSRAIADLTDAHLVTQIRNRDALLRAGLRENIDFTAIDSERLAGPAHRLATLIRGGKGKGWTTSTAVSGLVYPYFEHLVWEKFKHRIHAGEFDLVHRITPLTPTMPSPLATNLAHAKVPFVIGPLNGGVPWPKWFDAERRQEKEYLSYVRDAYRLLPGYWNTRRRAAAILAGSRDAWDQIPRIYRGKSFYVPENAIDPQRFTIVRHRRAVRPLRCVFVGRLVPYKGADMLLHAAAPLLKSGELQLDIIGDGPQLPLLKQIVETHGLQSSVQMGGWVPHLQLQQRLADADLFTFPSIREFGGAVVLEAMAVGVVPIVVDYGGPGELVTPETGYLIPIGPRTQIIANLRELLVKLVQDPGQIDARSGPAHQRAHTHFTWSAKARRVCEIYSWVCDPSHPKPSYPIPTP